MAENGNTAEHELLKMIEGQEGVNLKDKSKEIPSPLDSTKDQLSEIFSGISEKISLDKIKEIFHVAFINKILLVLIGISIFVYLFVGIAGLNRLENIPKFDFSSMKTITGAIKSMNPPLKDYAYYMDILLGRNIFKEIDKTEKVVTEKTVGIKDFAAELRLVGISWAESEADRYAMIEDLKTEITRYVQVGDPISDFIVEEIFEKKIVLKYGEQKIDLR